MLVVHSLRRASIALMGAVTLVAACSSSDDGGPLPKQDFAAVEGVEAKFDRNTIVDSASFTDYEAVDAELVRRFLHKTPYDTTSFLETYQSNGVEAADAIARAARTYHVNAIIFLVYAEAVQGLVAATTYPFPPERVEYAFRCGCLSAGNCLPELAGFDRQVDCLGRALRTSIDAIAKDGETTAGWGPDKTSTTLDGLKVTPANDATAALYDRTPFVQEGKQGGTWLLWNLWNYYAVSLDYAGSFGGGGGAGAVGDPCSSATTCGYEGAICATNYPGGLCTLQCKGDCPSQPDGPAAFCADFGTEGGFCMEVCNPGAPACRDGYKCINVARFNGSGPNDSQHVCYPTNAQP